MGSILLLGFFFSGKEHGCIMIAGIVMVEHTGTIAGGLLFATKEPAMPITDYLPILQEKKCSQT